jgi:hypothetical protein
VASTGDFVKRLQYYAMRAYTTQLKIGGICSQLKSVVFLGILDFVLFPDEVNSPRSLCDPESGRNIPTDNFGAWGSESFREENTPFGATGTVVRQAVSTMKHSSTGSHSFCHLTCIIPFSLNLANEESVFDSIALLNEDLVRCSIAHVDFTTLRSSRFPYLH